jgi:hypothetical protein
MSTALPRIPRTTPNAISRWGNPTTFLTAGKGAETCVSRIQRRTSRTGMSNEETQTETS